MPNPGGNYPGRQLFLGNANGLPAFVYVVTGRSPPSKMRYASPFLKQESAIRLKPVNPEEPFDQFRHYQAVRIDPKTGLLVVSNSQAPNDAVFEAYNCMTDEEKIGDPYLQRLLAAIGAEYDSKEKPTPRIIGVAFPLASGGFGNTMAITTQKFVASQLHILPENNMLVYNGMSLRGIKHHMELHILPENMLVYIQTYNGDVDYRNPDTRGLGLARNIFNTSGKTPQELADELFDSTDYVDPKYGDLRVCTVAGVHNGNGPGGWELARRNVHSIE